MTEALSTSFIAALMLSVAILGGYMAKWIRIPRIVALILGGVGLKFFVSAQAGDAAAVELVAPLRFINEIALGLILFIIGGVFEASRLKSTKGKIHKMSAWEMGLTFLLTSLGCGAAAWTIAGMTLPVSLATGALLGCVAIATAPAATWYVLQEYDAKGPSTDHLLVMTGINNLVSIISFHTVFIAFIAFGLITQIQGPPRSWWLDIFFVSIGSIGLGVLVGWFLSFFHSRLPLREMILTFFAFLFLLSAGDEWMLKVLGTAFYPMITCLIMGIVFGNKARDASHFESTLEVVSLPIFALFFVLAGYNLHWEELGHLGILGIVYLAMRTWGKYKGIQYAVRGLKDITKVKENAGLGLLSHAGVAIFLGTFLVEHWTHDMAVKINTVILASVALCELIGPLLVKYVVINAGEVKAVTLIRPSLFHRTWISAKTDSSKASPQNPAPSKSNEKALQAKHLMRSNIHFLPESASFDDVLSFIEKSRFHDFPVVDKEGRYAGMVHFQKVRDQIYNPALIKLVTAGSLADKGTPAATPEMEPSALLGLFHKHNLGEIAVVENLKEGKLIGLLEQRDLLRHEVHPSS